MNHIWVEITGRMIITKLNIMPEANHLTIVNVTARVFDNVPCDLGVFEDNKLSFGWLTLLKIN